MRTRENTATAKRTTPTTHAHPRPGDPASREAAIAAAKAALEKKALEPVLLNVSELTSYADYILVVSGGSDRQVEAIASGIVEALEARGLRLLGVEGIGGGKWTLIDFGDLIVHVFYHPMREHFDLEGLWVDAERVPLEIPPEARAPMGEQFF